MWQILLTLLALGSMSTITLPRTFLTSAQYAALDQQLLFVETWSDVAQVEIPFPLTFNTLPTDLDFSCFTCAVTTPGATRSNYSGATLISPSWGVVAAHTPGDGTGYFWKRKDTGVEVFRTRTTNTNIAADLSLIRFNAPVTTIQPAVVFADLSDVSGRKALMIQPDRHLTSVVLGHGADSSGATSISNSDVDIYAGRAIADGDSWNLNESGKPVLVPVAGRMGLVVSALESRVLAPNFDFLYGPNPSHYIAEINAILAADGESLTLVEFPPFTDNAIVAGISTPIQSPIASYGDDE